MVEGGLFAWNRQKIDTHRGPAGSYAELNRPLPDPPKDMHWVQDIDTKEWQLAKITSSSDSNNNNKLPPDAIIIDAVAETHELGGSIIEHTIDSSDTFEGICLRYKVTPTELRRANGGFSGTNLHLVPNPLRIPVNQKYLDSTDNNNLHYQEANNTYRASVDSPAKKIRHLLKAYPTMSSSEAKCYLELNDWDVEAALENAKEDGFYE